MANQKLMKKVAPVVLSAAVAMTSMPAAAFAADFSDAEVAVATEEDTEAEVEDSDVDLAEEVTDADDAADVEVEEDTEDAEITEEEASEENLFSAEEDFSAEAGADQTEGEAYVLMNIPYDDFYKAELKNNDVKVDTFTSATKQKTRSGYAKGSYHVNVDGSDITGVTFPVKVSDISVLKDKKQIKDNDSVSITTAIKGKETTTEYKGKDALFESNSYSYYVLSEEPSYYKELTVGEDGSFTFSAIEGKSATPETKQVQAEFKTKSNYGDYQLKFDKTEFNSIINTDTDTVYGAVINTTDGTTYGLCHQENIWKGYELAWSTGYTTESHGCHLNFEHFKSMMGKTIDSVTYYASNGIYTLDIADVKVLSQTGVSATVANIHTTDTEAAVTLDGTLPEAFEAKYTVDGTEVTYADGKITTGALAAGSHTLVISDAKGEYAPIQTSFYAKEANVPAVYDAAEHKLVAAEGVTADQLTAYIKTITAVTVGNKTYQASGKGAKVIVKEDGTLDLSDLEVTNETKFVVTSSVYDDLAFTYGAEDYKYVYAGLTWAQYWAAEGVYEAGKATASADKDTREEADLGAFDTVTRATVNHGLHRGSYQTTAVIEGEKGSYSVSHWEGQNTVVFTDGNKATFNRGTLTFADGTTDEMVDYKVSGLKYVPVKVKAEDYEAFKKEYAVVENDGALVGGYGEMNLKSYNLTADVTANTNGLKTAVKNEDGTFSFGARANGTDSGVKDTALKKATDIITTVKDASGSYGEFLRVDLTGSGYGDLGAAMQAVKWTYYGNDSTYTNALQTYGTKFAADNWMHKANGIQLGLTKSLRCQLPEGYDGTGYWTLTVYALGYEDYTVQFQATDANIVKPTVEKPDTTKLEAVIAEAKALKESDYTAASWEKVANELEECEDMLKNIDKQTQNGVDEQIGHLREAIDTLVKAQFKLNATSGSLYTKKTATLKVTTNLTGTVTWKSSNTKVATVSSKGVVTAKAAGTATITASLSGKTAAYKVTVKNPGITAKVAQVYVGKTAKVQVTTFGVSGKAKFATSNKKIATVSSTGVVTGKKAGTAKITVSVGNYKKVLTVKVNKPTFSLVKSSASLKKGKKVAIKVKAAPVSKVTYKTSNKKVATVSSTGVVTAKKKGTAKITVKCNGITRTFKVTVK